MKKKILLILSLILTAFSAKSQIIDTTDKSGYDYYGDIIFRYTSINDKYISNKMAIILDSLSYKMKHIPYEFNFVTNITCYCGAKEKPIICHNRYVNIRRYLRNKHDIKHSYFKLNIKSTKDERDEFIKNQDIGYIRIGFIINKKIKNPYKY